MKKLEENTEKLEGLLEEYREIEKRLEESLLDHGKERVYRDLIDLIIRIADYIFRETETTKKGIGEVMGGRVLELPSERLIQQGINQGKEENACQTAKLLLKTGKLSVEEIAEVTGVSLEKITQLRTEK